MDDFAQATLKAQLNEYHLMVAEVLSGMDNELCALKNRLDAMAGAAPGFIEGEMNLLGRLQALEMRQQRAEAEVERIRTTIAALQTGVHHMLRNIEERISRYAP